ncbi:hypothetical protein THAOC_34548 [Thalassiosira oceanica]|uniref:PDZ domain-containing protein n=1 Tax=Thalassiosira oceanica TaxID=159749 RepID=K0RCI2_THAOC|nr:hypothetical protein THAOC_34548 [Thalassiosira oceanica]|mmetsp:Transcript_8002/g.18400  ORF Transcript_8002/g.18400 Transcript_8002/m.18400 type:complete len:321 (+) Transcript_8002:43-1005(+)|eukprot:EJK46766.1 hypothetical protein THAOC_34548 [Thalassiosira oceanica]
MASTEEYDSFPAATDDPPAILFDQGSLAIVSDTRRAGRGATSGGSRASRSAATTQLATEVGSTVVARRNPFLKSITFFDPEVYYRKAREAVDDGEGGSGDGSDGAEENDKRSCDDHEADDDATFEVNDMSHWDITLRDPTAEELLGGRRGVINRLKKNKGPRLVVEDYEGLVEFSSVQSGDRLVSINKKKIKPEEYSADGAMVYMRSCLEDDGVLNVTTEDPHGQDILINVTVIKPRPAMSYEDLGLVVWNWPFLCVKEIKDDSIFQHTALKETDQIAAINDIDCQKMREKAFAKCVRELPTEITITVIRRKHRYTGSFT